MALLKESEKKKENFSGDANIIQLYLYVYDTNFSIILRRILFFVVRSRSKMVN